VDGALPLCAFAALKIGKFFKDICMRKKEKPTLPMES
jgi:hypothetical protein